MNKELERIAKFLDEVGTYYLATVDLDQPKLRPFGTALIYKDRLYIQTGKVKDVSKQIAKNPKVAICAFEDGTWLRIEGELANDDTREVKTLMLDKMPVLRNMYSEDDDNTQMLYFKHLKATFSSFSSKPEVIEL